MESIQPGKSHAIRFPDIFITLTEVKPFSTFHHHHLEDKSKIITSSLQNLFGTGMLQTAKFHGTQAVLQLLMLTILSVNILKELIHLLEANVKEEILASNKDGL